MYNLKDPEVLKMLNQTPSNNKLLSQSFEDKDKLIEVKT